MTLDPGAARFLSLLGAALGGGSEAADPESRRAALRGLALTAERAPETPGLDVRDLTAPGGEGERPARAYAPERARPGVILHFHGGGYVAGDFDTHDAFCRRLAHAAQRVVVAVDYRLAPENPFPAALEDARAAAAWACDGGAPAPAGPVVLSGDSAGGGLAARAAIEATRSRIAYQLLICPILDLVGGSEAWRRLGSGHFIERTAFETDTLWYLAGADPRDPRASPVYEPALADAPPALIHAAEYDPFGDDAAGYAAALGRSGVEAAFERHAGMIHYFYAITRVVRAGGRIVEQIGADLGARLDALS